MTYFPIRIHRLDNNSLISTSLSLAKPSGMEKEAMERVNENINSRFIVLHQTEPKAPSIHLPDTKQSLVESIRNSNPPIRQTRKKRDAILHQYEQEFGQQHNSSIITSTKGEHFYSKLPNHLTLLRNHPMKSSSRHQYEVQPSIEGAIFVLTKYIFTSIDQSSPFYDPKRLDIVKKLGEEYNHLAPFAEESAWFEVLANLSRVNSSYNDMISNFSRLRDLDFTPLIPFQIMKNRQRSTPIALIWSHH
jgi:hypothetical protein